MAILTKTVPSSTSSFYFWGEKVSISLGKFCLKLTKCVTIKYSFNEVIWLSLQ